MDTSYAGQAAKITADSKSAIDTDAELRYNCQCKRLRTGIILLLRLTSVYDGAIMNKFP
jgi:hypothetical protein